MKNLVIICGFRWSGVDSASIIIGLNRYAVGLGNSKVMVQFLLDLESPVEIIICQHKHNGVNCNLNLSNGNLGYSDLPSCSHLNLCGINDRKFDFSGCGVRMIN